jgi:small subunit ribosomal protein S20
LTVAHSLSAKKRVRQTLKRNARNRARKAVLKDQLKTFTLTLAGGDKAKIDAEMNKTASRLDKLAAKGTIHKNAAARKRSRLAKKANAIKAGAKVSAVVGAVKGHGTHAAKA